MDWKAAKWKLNIKSGKDKWLILLAVGLIFLILALPSGKTKKEAADYGALGQPKSTGNAAEEKETAGGNGTGATGEGSFGAVDTAMEGTEGAEAAAKAALTYEQQLEARLEELLSRVEGVGRVKVMIVLRSSEEKVWRVDKDTSSSMTQETDQGGGTRRVESQELSESTILSGQSGQEEPLLEKEIKPEVGGVVVTAEGGGSPQVQAEISAAVEALFDVPSHKVKILKADFH